MPETSLKDLKVDPKNARKHNSRNIGLIESSLRKVGAARSGVIDENGVILAGNGTYEALARAGIEKVKVIEADGNEWVVVKRTGLTEQQKRELALADNRAAELAEWDGAVLKAQGIDLAPWFTEQELRKIGADTGNVGDDGPEPRFDEAEALRAKYGVELGQIWQLGDHRLMCGDSTKGEDVDQVIKPNEASLCFTDPPYGVNVTGAGGHALHGDLTFTLIPFCFDGIAKALRPGSAVYMCGGSSNVSLYYRLFEKFFRSIPHLIVWVKDSFVLRRSHYHSQFELIFYGWKPGESSRWFGDRKQADVWHVDRDKFFEHPTVKPIELVAKAINNSSDREEIVYDPFLGSGTTLIACEQLGRRCYAMEISPAYVAVAIQRWVDLTGKEPKLL